MRLLLLLCLLLQPAWAEEDNEPPAGPTNPVLQELHQLNEDQQAEVLRLVEIRDHLPLLSHAQSEEFAEKLATNLNDVLTRLSSAQDDDARLELVSEANDIMETVSLLSERIDPDDRIDERIRAHEQKVEHSRLPVKVLFAVTSIINTLSGLTKGYVPDLFNAVEEHSLEPYTVSSENEWIHLQALEFIEAFKKHLGPSAKGLKIMPGLDGALKSTEPLAQLLRGRKCEFALSGGPVVE